MLDYIKLKLILGLLILGLSFSCSSTSTRNEQSSNPVVQKAQKQFYKKATRSKEVFKIFVSSDNYVIKQVSKDGKIAIKTDPSGEKSFVTELQRYDMVNHFSEAIFSVELYEDSGVIAKIRPIKPASVAELNKIIADDITRLQFEFPGEKITPVKFYIRYGILLQKKLSAEERRNILKNNAK